MGNSKPSTNKKLQHFLEGWKILTSDSETL